MYFIRFSGPTRGFFSIFLEVVRCIDFAVTNGLTYYVDLSESNSLYTDVLNKNGDKNIWNYFFIQHLTEVPNKHLLYSASKYEGWTTKIWLRSHFNKINMNVIKHLQFQPQVLEVLNQVNPAIRQATLGVHIRKTDHYTEVPTVPVENYIKLISKKIEKNKYKNLFIATDDETVLELIKETFKNVNVLYNDVSRSKTGDPVHKSQNDNNGFKLGLDALTDVYCLSLCKDVILSNSNFSYCVLYFNPGIKFSLLDGFASSKIQKVSALNFAGNIMHNFRYHFFHNANLLTYYRKWKGFKKRIARISTSIF